MPNKTNPNDTGDVSSMNDRYKMDLLPDMDITPKSLEKKRRMTKNKTVDDTVSSI